MPRISEAAVKTMELVRENPVEIIRRVAPPLELNAEQREEFVRVVNSMPAEWFVAANTAMLAQYCRHVVMARRIAEAIDGAMSEGDATKVETLLRAQARESKMISQMMTSLRMTPQAIEPRGISARKMQQTDSPWSGFGKQRR